MSSFRQHPEKSNFYAGFNITTVAPGERPEVIKAARELILKNSGNIVDYDMPSDLSVHLTVELLAFDCLQLIRDLIELGWKVEVNPDSAEIEQREDEMLEGRLEITFPEAHGDLIMPVLGTPG